MANKRLQSEYKQYLKEPNQYYILTPSETDFTVWNIMLFGSLGSIFEGYIFDCQMIFPIEYPNKPPILKFLSKLPHPNIYPDGKVCISILHDEIDVSGHDQLNEQWSPAQSVHSILLSVLSLLVEPNLDSPANIDITKLWRNDFENYKKLVYKIITQY